MALISDTLNKNKYKLYKQKLSEILSTFKNTKGIKTKTLKIDGMVYNVLQQGENKIIYSVCLLIYELRKSLRILETRSSGNLLSRIEEVWGIRQTGYKDTYNFIHFVFVPCDCVPYY